MGFTPLANSAKFTHPSQPSVSVRHLHCLCMHPVSIASFHRKCLKVAFCLYRPLAGPAHTLLVVATIRFRALQAPHLHCYSAVTGHNCCFRGICQLPVAQNLLGHSGIAWSFHLLALAQALQQLPLMVSHLT